MTEMRQWDPQDVPPGLVATYGGHDCCAHHSLTCEPPSELCCGACVEAEHPAHPPATVCVLTVATIWVAHERAAQNEAREMVEGLHGLLDDHDRHHPATGSGPGHDGA